MINIGVHWEKQITILGEIVGIMSLLLIYGTPFFLIIRLKWIGFLISFFIIWFGPLIIVDVLRVVDPQYKIGILPTEIAQLAGLWLVGGWLPSLIFCGIVIGIQRLIAKIKEDK